MRRFVILQPTKISYTMSIKYEIQTIRNSQGCGKDRYFARIFEHEQLTGRQLETLIQTNCSLTIGDIHAVLIALREQMLHQLSTGRRVHIPEIGYFSLAVNIDLPDDNSASKARANDIRVRNIHFRPDMSLLNDIRQQTQFESAQFSTVSKKYTEESLRMGICEYFETHHYINRRILEKNFSLRKNTALAWLKHFTETGLLRKEGAHNAPMYFLA